MAAPNIINPTTITGKTTYFTPSGTTAVVLLTNAASSGKVLKINSVIAANVDGTNAVDVTVAYYTDGAVAQGSGPSGGTAYSIVSTVSVPADASLIVIDKSTQLYIEEDNCLTVTVSSADDVTFVVSYEEIS
jgi:hypothetical protein